MALTKESTKKKSEVSEAESVKKTEKYYAGVGRRKTAVATVRLSEVPSEGTEPEVTVNDRSIKQYFPTMRLQSVVLAPAKAVGISGAFHVSVHVRGGGPSGQAAAAALGLARAIVLFDAGHRQILKAGKFLSRDARKVERKKAGLKKARRAPQWAKR